MEPSSFRIRSRSTLHHRFLRRKNSRENLDRFIPNRAAMDLSYAHYMVTGGTKRGKESPTWSDEAYQNLLADTFNMNRRIFYFKNKPPVLEDPIPQYLLPSSLSSTSAIRSRPRHIPKSSERKLDCPDLVDDIYLNSLDWGNNNVVAVALGDTVYLWNASDGAISELLTVSGEDGPVTSVNWAPDGRCIAVGLDNSDVQIWDCYATRLLRTLSGGHRLRVNSLAWNNHILTSGGEDSKIINNDVRARDFIVERYRGHNQQVCGLKWSDSGRQLASGGNDNLVFIWDKLMASSNSPTQWLHKLEEHTDTVKALAWCPFQANLLSSGGGEDDRCIKFWNTQTGACLNSLDTGSQVCSLLWNKHEPELLGAHGFPQNQLSLWKYPSMVKMAELYGHTSRVLFMSQSPDGYQVATAAAAPDETLQIWNMFGIPEVARPAPKENPEPFSNVCRIR